MELSFASFWANLKFPSRNFSRASLPFLPLRSNSKANDLSSLPKTPKFTVANSTPPEILRE